MQTRKTCEEVLHLSTHQLNHIEMMSQKKWKPRLKKKNKTNLVELFGTQR